MSINTVTKNNISEIVSLQRCTGCGACVALCPIEAIELPLNNKKGLFVPEINDRKCNECGVCQKVCPAFGLGNSALNVNYLNKAMPTPLLGEYLSCHIGHATDDLIRYAAASGGLVTQLLIFALEAGVIDGALVTKMSQEDPLRPEPFVAHTKEEIVEAATSKYCPVPLCCGLKEVLWGAEEKIAVVGLPCHIRAIRKAEESNSILKKRIVLHMGIICSHTDSFHGTDFVLNKLKLSKNQLSKLKYRGDGWPGGIKIISSSGQDVSVPHGTPLWRSFFDGLFFAPLACLSCSDLSCEQADLSFGDPWLREIKEKENLGKSVAICRTSKGQILLNDAIKAGAIQLDVLAPWDAVRSQRTFLHFKKINILVRRKDDKTKLLHVSYINRVAANMVRFSRLLGSSSFGRFVLGIAPVGILSKYVSLFYKVYSEAIRRDFAVLEGKSGLNILVLHAHWNNRGDEAAIRAMVDSLKLSLPVSRIAMMLMAKPGTVYPDKQVEVVELYPGGSKLTYLDALISVLSWGKLSLTRRGRGFLAAVDNADLVIHAPGGPSVGDMYGGRLKDLPYLYRLLVARVFKRKPLFFYAPSMGPFTMKRYNWLRKLILSRADQITLREEISARYLREQLGIDAYVTADSALQNEISEAYLSSRGDLNSLFARLQSDKYVGMVITDLKWHPIYRHDSNIGEKIIANLCSFAEFLVKNGYKILLIPQLFGESSDYDLLEKVASVDRGNISILPIDVDAYAQQLIIAKLFCVVTVRYHPVIFAVKAGVPVISVYYEHKTKGFLEKAGIAEFGVDVQDVDVQKLIDLFRRIESEHPDLSQHLRLVGADLKREAQCTTQIIAGKWVKK